MNCVLTKLALFRQLSFTRSLKRLRKKKKKMQRFNLKEKNKLKEE